MRMGEVVMGTAEDQGGLPTEVVQVIKDTDLRIRAAGVGKTIEEAAQIAASEFHNIGVVLPGDDLRDYALSVIEERPHKFNINM